MIDTHAHIYSKQFGHDLDAVLNDTFNNGVEMIFMPNIDSDSVQSMLQVEERYKGRCFPMMGLHPCSVKEDFELQLEKCATWLERRRFLAIGEMGLDLYWDKSYFEQQKQAFRIQAQWAKKYQLPLVVHTRDAMKETIDLLEELSDDKLRGVVHCFTGSVDEAHRIIKLGFVLGIGGVSTYKNGGLDSVLPYIDMEHLVLETDSPYLAPVPFRGKRNSPQYLHYIAQRIAELKNVDLSTVVQLTSANAAKLFKPQLMN